MGVTGWFHAGITVCDMDRSVEFYREGLGLSFDWETESSGDAVRTLIALPFDHIRNVFFRIPGGGRIELLEYHGIERRNGAARPCDPGSGHLSLYVDDIETVVASAREHGGTTRSAGVVSAGTDGAVKVVYLADPDGFVIELFQRATRPTA